MLQTNSMVKVVLFTLKARGITLVLVCQLCVYGYALDLVALWLVAHWGQQMVLEKCA